MEGLFKDLVDVVQSFVEFVKVVDPHEMALRLKNGSIMEKRLRNKKLRQREKTLTDMYEANGVDIRIEKNQCEKILAQERAEMILRGKMLPDSLPKLKKSDDIGRAYLGTYNPLRRPKYSEEFRRDVLGRAVHKDHSLENRIELARKEMIAKGKLLPDSLPVQKKPHEVGKAIFRTYNPFVRPNYSENFKRDFFGRASHIDRYTEVLPQGSWLLLPERYFSIMRIATLPINAQTIDIKEMNVSVKDYNQNIGSILVDAALTYVIVDVKKAYLNAGQYTDYIHTKVTQYLAEHAANRTYEFWRGTTGLSQELAKEVDRNNAVGLLQGIFTETDGQLAYTQKQFPVDPNKAKDVDDLVDRKKYYGQDKFVRSNTSILAMELSKFLNIELTKNYGIVITSVGLKEWVPTKPQRLILSGQVFPDTISLINSSEAKTIKADYE